MNIAPKTVVSLTYVLKDGGAEGEIVEVTTADRPLVFLYGAGQMLPKFEEHLANKATGDEFQFLLESNDAYGSVMQDQIVAIPIDNFKVDGVLQEDMLQVGKLLTMRGQQGQIHRAKVLAFDEQTVKMDFNHPMAGKNLHFSGNIIGVREATADEISHGHVHGPGGVEH